MLKLTQKYCLYVSLSMCLLPFTIHAQTPTIKPGLWETTSTGFGDKPFKHTQCVKPEDNAASEKASKDYVKAHCTGVKESQTGNLYVVEMVCTDNGIKMANRTEVKLISANEINSKTISVTNGTKTVMENHTKRLGDCSAKNNAADTITDAKGNKFDLKQLEAAIKKQH